MHPAHSSSIPWEPCRPWREQCLLVLSAGPPSPPRTHNQTDFLKFKGTVSPVLKKHSFSCIGYILYTSNCLITNFLAKHETHSRVNIAVFFQFVRNFYFFIYHCNIFLNIRSLRILSLKASTKIQFQTETDNNNFLGMDRISGISKFL
jgi:hypothetical protein